MLNLFTDSRDRDCEGTSRREFLRIGTLGAGALTLPGLLAARAQAALGVLRQFVPLRSPP